MNYDKNPSQCTVQNQVQKVGMLVMIDPGELTWAVSTVCKTQFNPLVSSATVKEASQALMWRELCFVQLTFEYYFTG